MATGTPDIPPPDVLRGMLNELGPEGRAAADAWMRQNNIATPEGTNAAPARGGPDGNTVDPLAILPAPQTQPNGSMVGGVPMGSPLDPGNRPVNAPARYDRPDDQKNFQEAVRRVGVPASTAIAVTPPAPDAGGGQPTRAQGTEVLDPFTIGPRVQEEFAGVSKATDALGTAMDSLIATNETVMPQRKALMEQRVAENATVLAEQEESVRHLRDRTKPLFARREAISARKQEINQMGGLERTFAGIFNKNYDQDYLQNQDDQIRTELGEIGDTFQQQMATGDALNRIIGAKYEGQDAILAAIQSDAQLALNMRTQSAEVARTRLNTTIQGLQTNTEILRNQMQAADAKLGSIADEGELTQMENNAKKGGGQLNVGGVVLNTGQIQERRRQIQTQNMELERAQLAMQASRMDLAAASHRKLITEGMTTAELRAAADNDYVFRGQRLQGSLVEQEIQGRLAGANGRAEQAGVEMQGRQFNQAWQQYADAYNGTNQRERQIFGNAGGQQRAALLQSRTAFLHDTRRALAGMPEGPAKLALQAKFVEQIGGFIKSDQEALEARINGANRDGDVRLLLKSWVTNAPLTPDQTARGLVKMLQSGGPLPGVNPNGAAAQQMNAARIAMESVYKKYGGKENFDAQVNGVQSRGGKRPPAPNAAQLQRELTTAITTAVSKNYINSGITQGMQQAPNWAKADGHAAGRIRSQDIISAQEIGTEKAYEQLASQVSGAGVPMTVDQARAVWSRKTAKPQNVSDALFADMNQKLQVWTAQYMGQALDRTPSASPGFVPSRALSDYLRSPGYQGRIAASDQTYGYRGFGEHLVGNMTQGSLTAASQAMARNFAIGLASGEREAQRSSIENAAMYRNDPYIRASAIVRAAGGVDDATAAAVVAEIRRQAPGISTGGHARGDLMGAEIMYPGERESRNAAVGAALRTQWQDPRLEAVRKKLAPKWEELGRTVDSAMQAFEKAN